jgi:hypothetical protein
MHYGLPTCPRVHLLMTRAAGAANEGTMTAYTQQDTLSKSTGSLSSSNLISSTDTACLVSLAHVNSVVYLSLQPAIDEVFIFNVLHQDDIIVFLKATRYLQRRIDNFKSP